MSRYIQFIANVNIVKASIMFTVNIDNKGKT